MPQASYSAKRRRKRILYRLRQRAIEIALILSVFFAIFFLVRGCVNRNHNDDSVSSDIAVSTPVETLPVIPNFTNNTITLTDEVDAQSAVLIDCATNELLAAKDAQTAYFPASVTKVMSLLVAVENIDDFYDTFTMTYDIMHPLYLQNATIVGFMEDEEVQLMDLLYGAILPSGADATQALAEYVSGSEAAFAELMNERAEEMGLQNTHFTNTSGLHDPNHYTCALDVAIIMREAMRNPLCRKVLTTHTYMIKPTEHHPDGIPLANAMIGRVKTNQPEGGTVVGGKTGYTDQAGHTMASLAVGDDGHEYVFVSLKGTNKYAATNDAIKVYGMFCGDKQ